MTVFAYIVNAILWRILEEVAREEGLRGGEVLTELACVVNANSRGPRIKWLRNEGGRRVMLTVSARLVNVRGSRWKGQGRRG